MILLPDKHTNIKLSVFAVSARTIKLLQQNGIARYQQILDQLIEELGEDVKYVFMSSITFLFAMGKIKYHTEIDSIEII